MMNTSSSGPEPLPQVRPRQTKVAQAADTIKQRIKRGIYTPGHQLPSLRTLGSELNLTVPVLQRAIRQLEREGVLESHHGIGIRVLNTANCRSTPLFFGFIQPYFSHFSLALQHYLEDALDNRSNLCVMKSTHNDPERERREIDRLISSGVNGLMIWPVDGDENGEYLQEISKLLPTVLVDRTLPNLRVPSVVLDYAKAGHDIMRYLLRRGCRSIMVVCDPVNISSFNQLKSAMRTENHEADLKFVDFPIIRMIETSYEGYYDLADACYAQLAPILKSQECDAIFCPQSEFFDLVFASGDRAKVLAGVERATMRTPSGPPHSRYYHQLGVDEWIIDTARMLVVALDLLQDMTLSRVSWHRTVKIPIVRVPKSKSQIAARPPS